LGYLRFISSRFWGKIEAGPTSSLETADGATISLSRYAAKTFGNTSEQPWPQPRPAATTYKSQPHQLTSSFDNRRFESVSRLTSHISCLMASRSIYLLRQTHEFVFSDMNQQLAPRTHPTSQAHHDYFRTECMILHSLPISVSHPASSLEA
jgi:hypothetical protein